VKRGTLKLEDIFVSGINEGRVKLMTNDKAMPIKEAYPGEAVHLVGFKAFPDVGNPLYVVENPEHAKFIIDKVKGRYDASKLQRLASNSDNLLATEMKKEIGKLTKIEKVALKKGDKTILYEKLGLIEESDLKDYQKKFGIKGDQLTTGSDLTE